jgi:hypothetical protein
MEDIIIMNNEFYMPPFTFDVFLCNRIYFDFTLNRHYSLLRISLFPERDETEVCPNLATKALRAASHSHTRF